MRISVAKEIPSQRTRSRFFAASPIAAMPITTALSADSTTLMNTTWPSAISVSMPPGSMNDCTICPRYFGVVGKITRGGGSSEAGDWMSILILLGSMVDGASSRPVTSTGKAITSATMMSCRPTHGSAPQ